MQRDCSVSSVGDWSPRFGVGPRLLFRGLVGEGKGSSFPRRKSPSVSEVFDVSVKLSSGTNFHFKRPSCLERVRIKDPDHINLKHLFLWSERKLFLFYE